VGLNHSGTTGASSIAAQASLAIVRSLSRSCGKEFSFVLRLSGFSAEGAASKKPKCLSDLAANRLTDFSLGYNLSNA
jgi:hypothetical protein